MMLDFCASMTCCCVCCWQIIMDRLYKAVQEKVSEGGKFQQALFNYAYEYKRKKFEAGFNTPLIDA